MNRELLKPTGRRTAWVCLLLMLVLPAAMAKTAYMENARFNRLTLEDGLSQSSVNCIVQDNQGFLWFGTQDGLNRYDGYEFKTFHHDDQDPGSISNNFVWALHVDKNGVLWVGSEGGGLDRWNPTDESFTNYRHDPNDPNSLLHNEIRALGEDRDGALWVGTGGGLSRFSPDDRTFTHYTHDASDSTSLADNQVRSILLDSGKRLWVGTFEGGLSRKDPGSDTFINYRHDPENDASLSSNKIRTVLEDQRGIIWIGTYDGGLNRLDPETGHVTRYRADADDNASLGNDKVRALFSDNTGTLWVGTDDGLNRLIDGTDRFASYHHDPADPSSLGSDRILSIYQDHGGLLWVATQAGLTHRNPALETFAHIKQDSETENTLSSNIITSFSQGKNNTVWVGTYGGGLTGLDLDSGAFEHVRHDTDNPGSLADDRVMSLFHDSKGNLWVGSMTSGLSVRYAGQDDFVQFKNDPDDPASLSFNGVTAITEATDGTIWVGTYRGGLNRMLGDRRSFQRYNHEPDNPNSISTNQVMSLAPGEDGRVWVGTKDGGLNLFDPGTGGFTHFRHDPEDPKSIGDGAVWTIHVDAAGTMWLGTQGGGLNRWAREDRMAGNASFKRYTVRDGLANDFIYGILEDELGDLWLSSNKGISRFNTRGEVFTNFDSTHGLQSLEFNFGAYFRSRSGDMFFGGNNGFNHFHPADVRRNNHIPPVVLTGILKMNERVTLDRPAWDLTELVVDHHDQVVSFDFSALDYSAPEKNRYAYRLDGFDENWIDLGNMRRATFTNLDAGEYTLMVRASNNDGVWNEAGIALPIRVLPPPWKTWWAYTLYALAACFLILAIIQVQVRKLRREEEHSRHLEECVRERTEELAERNRELKTVNNKLEDASLTDALTGLRNRRYFQHHLQEDIALLDRRFEQARHGETPSDDLFNTGLLCLMIDLDGFKKINDTYGHAAGDQVLVETCNALSTIVRQSDTVIRWGGDEFLVLARSTGRDSAHILAERIRETIAGLKVRVDGDQVARVGCSLGYAFYPFLPTAPRLMIWEQVLKVADRALYMAKASGKDAWVGIAGKECARRPALLETLLSEPESLYREGAIEVSSNLEVEEIWANEGDAGQGRRTTGGAA